MPIDCCPLDENGHFPGCRLLARVAELEPALHKLLMMLPPSAISLCRAEVDAARATLSQYLPMPSVSVVHEADAEHGRTIHTPGYPCPRCPRPSEGLPPVHWNPTCEFCGKGRYCCKMGADDVQAAFEDVLARGRTETPETAAQVLSSEDRAWLLDEIRGAREVLAKIESLANDGMHAAPERLGPIASKARARKRSLDSVLRVAATQTGSEP